MSRIDEAVDHLVLTAQTQHGIIEVVKEMAKVMAEIGIASNKAVGDSVDTAINRWSAIMMAEARRIAKDKMASKPLPKKKLKAPTVFDHADVEKS